MKTSGMLECCPLLQFPFLFSRQEFKTLCLNVILPYLNLFFEMSIVLWSRLCWKSIALYVYCLFKNKRRDCTRVWCLFLNYLLFIQVVLRCFVHLYWICTSHRWYVAMKISTFIFFQLFKQTHLMVSDILKDKK